MLYKFKKIAEGLNKDQLTIIEKKMSELRKAVEDRDTKAFQSLIKDIQNIIPDSIKVDDSTDSFIEWVENKVDSDFDDLIGVGELVVMLLREKRKKEKDLRREKMLNAEAGLKAKIEYFKEKLALGDVKLQDKKDLYAAIIRSLEFLK